MKKLKVLDLFSGIGGFSLGLERTGGFETVAFCEIEPFPRKVLAKHWPEVPCYEDVTKLTGQQLAADGIAVDVITGGFPCQDISVAGKQAGIGEGTRSGLWSECLRLVSELRPSFAIFENVSNLLSGPSEQPGAWFSRILADLASVGYDAEWENIPASALGAPHRRERVWIVGYPSQLQRNAGEYVAGPCCPLPQVWQPRGTSLVDDVADTNGGIIQAFNKQSILGKPNKEGSSRGFANGSFQGGERPKKDVADTNGPQREGERQPLRISAQHRNISSAGRWRTEPGMGRVADGVPNRAHRLKGLGNAVVPQIPELIGRAILESMK